MKLFLEVQPSRGCTLLQDDVKAISDWCRTNLLLNTVKTIFRYYRKKNNVVMFPYISADMSANQGAFELYIDLLSVG